MAVQYDPIAKDESLNTTELSPRNIADVLAEGLDDIAQAIGGGGGGGGHVIQNDSGTDMTQRAKLQFKDLSVTDDSGNDRTIVSASGKADKTDLTSIIATGSTNNTGSTIYSGERFYKDGVECTATADIASGATFTLGTNYSVPPKGWLNEKITHTVSNTATDVTVSGNCYQKGDLWLLELYVLGGSSNVTISGWQEKKVGTIANWNIGAKSWQRMCAPFFSAIDGSFGGSLSISASGEIGITAVSSAVTIKAGHYYLTNCSFIA